MQISAARQTFSLRISLLGIALIVLGSAVPLVAQELPEEFEVQIEEWKARLALTDEQRQEIEALLARLEADLEAMDDETTAGSEQDMQSMRDQFEASQEAFHEGMSEILTDEQKTELEQIREEARQLALERLARTRAESLGEDFGLSPTQIDQVTEVYLWQQDELMALGDKMESKTDDGEGSGRRRGPGSRRGAIKAVRNVRSIVQETDTKLQGILDEDQWSAYQALRPEGRRKSSRGSR